MAYAETSEVKMAEGDELAKVKELMVKLEPEIKKLQEVGNDFPHTTGEIFMTRLLRGNNGNMDESVTWYRNFLELRTKYGLDAIHKDCEEKSIPWVSTRMPLHEEVEKYWNSTFDEDNLRTLTGNLIWYDALGDAKFSAMLKELGSEKFLKYMYYSAERRTSALDKISKTEHKVVKITRVMDCEGMGFWMMNRDWVKLDKQELEPVLMGTSIEVIHVCFIINFPAFLMRFYDVLKLALPKRLVARFRPLGSNFLQDKEFLTEVGADNIQKLLATKRVNSGEDKTFTKEGGPEVVPASRAVERVVNVEAGQTVSWEFTIGKSEDASSSAGFFSRMASKLSGSDVFFSVSALWTDKQVSEISLVKVKVRSAGTKNGDVAEFWLDGKQVEYTAGPGVNLVAVEPITQKVIVGQAFDFSKDVVEANRSLASAIENLPRACFVLIGVKGTGAEEISDEGWSALQECGSTLKGGGHYQKGFALVGIKGGQTCVEARDADATVETDMPTEESRADLLAPREVTDSSGKQTGSYKVDRGGMIVLRWSNEHAMVSNKSFASYKIIVE